MHLSKKGPWLDVRNMGLLPDTLKLRIAHAPVMPGTFSPPPTSKEMLVSDPGMHHGTCVTHVPWCMLGSLSRGGGENVPGILSACTTHNFAYLSRGPLRQFHLCSKIQERISSSFCSSSKTSNNTGWSDLLQLNHLSYPCVIQKAGIPAAVSSGTVNRMNISNMTPFAKCPSHRVTCKVSSIYVYVYAHVYVYAYVNVYVYVYVHIGTMVDKKMGARQRQSQPSWKGMVFDPSTNQAKFLGQFRCVLLPAHCYAQNFCTSQKQQKYTKISTYNKWSSWSTITPFDIFCPRWY